MLNNKNSYENDKRKGKGSSNKETALAEERTELDSISKSRNEIFIVVFMIK